MLPHHPCASVWAVLSRSQNHSCIPAVKHFDHNNHLSAAIPQHWLCDHINENEPHSLVDIFDRFAEIPQATCSHSSVHVAQLVTLSCYPLPWSPTRAHVGLQDLYISAGISLTELMISHFDRQLVTKPSLPLEDFTALFFPPQNNQIG